MDGSVATGLAFAARMTVEEWCPQKPLAGSRDRASGFFNMITNFHDKAIHFEAGVCTECKGTGQVVILDRRKTFATGRPHGTRMACPVCKGTGRHGIRVK